MGGVALNWLAPQLRAAGADFYDWGEGEARLVVSWNQPEADVDALAKLLKAL